MCVRVVGGVRLNFLPFFPFFSLIYTRLVIALLECCRAVCIFSPQILLEFLLLPSACRLCGRISGEDLPKRNRDQKSKSLKKNK